MIARPPLADEEWPFAATPARNGNSTMQWFLLYTQDSRPFAVDAIQQIFQSENRFYDVRFNEPGGAAIEADYVEENDSTIVRLSGNLETMSLSGTSDAALRVALILQRRLQAPLRIIDLDYSFDLALEDFRTVEELRTAIDDAQAA